VHLVGFITKILVICHHTLLEVQLTNVSLAIITAGTRVKSWHTTISSCKKKPTLMVV